jgi:hypothetical protein
VVGWWIFIAASLVVVLAIAIAVVLIARSERGMP